MSKYMRYPVNWVAITTYFSSSHYALDYGWNSAHGGANVPVYAVADGKVFDIGRSTGSGNAGIYVWTRHEFANYDILTRYAHLQDGSIKVYVGSTIKQGQQIANMGGTFGYANHLHHDVWKVPKGYKFNWGDRAKYAVNPTQYLFLFDDQSHGENANGVTRVVGSKNIVSRNTNNNQIEVVGSLKCRKGAGTNQSILGLIDYGIYNYSETKTANGYTWYNVGFGWIAGTKEDTKVYPKQEVKKIGKPVAKDTSKNQVEIITDILICRSGSGTSYTNLGLMNKGYYDFTDTFKDNTYTWYHLVDGWVADTKDDIKIYPKTEPLPDDKDKQIEELKKQVEKLDAEILAQKNLIEEQNEKIEKLTELLGNYSTLKVFEAPKKDYYYIVLNKDDKVYY